MRVRYLHSDIETLERVRILRDLRKENIGELLSSVYEADYAAIPDVAAEPEERYATLEELVGEIKVLEKQMREAAKALEFERAADLRDRIKTLRAREFGLK